MPLPITDLTKLLLAVQILKGNSLSFFKILQ